MAKYFRQIKLQQNKLEIIISFLPNSRVMSSGGPQSVFTPEATQQFNKMWNNST